MAPRKNAKRADDEPVEAVVEAGDVTPPKKKKISAKTAAIDDPKEVRHPRAAKNKKTEPIPEPVAPAVKKPVKSKAQKKVNDDDEEDAKKSRAKAPAKKTVKNDEETKGN